MVRAERGKAILLVYAVMAALYFLLVIANPIDNATLASRQLSLPQARIISFSIAVPLVSIWFIALFSALRLHAFSNGIKKHQDGRQFLQLSYGTLILAAYLPVRINTKMALNYIAGSHPGFQDAANIIVTYLNLLVPLVAFVIISQAARRLGNVAKTRSSLPEIYVLAGLYICMGVFFCYANFHVTDSISASNWLVTPQSVIPLPIRITTIMIPYLFMWFIGLLAAYELYLYQRLVKGIIYRQSLKLLSAGLMSIILASIAIQFITVSAANLQNLKFTAILALTYSLIALLGAAFAMTYKGVSRLERIDRV